jgi:hypothetical protein
LVLAGVASLEARVGETLEVLESRYGESFVVGVDEYDESCVVYGFDRAGTSRLRQKGFEVYAVLDKKQVCVELDYAKMFSVELERDDLQGILMSNSVGMSWKSVSVPGRETIYVRADGVIGRSLGAGRFEVLSADRARRREISPGDT